MHPASQESGSKVAAIMTVIASAQRQGLTVRDYLNFVLHRIADPVFKTGSLSNLLPTRWRPEKKQWLPDTLGKSLRPATVGGQLRKRNTRLLIDLR